MRQHSKNYVSIRSQVFWKLVAINLLCVFHTEGKKQKEGILVTPFPLIVQTIHAEVK